MGILTTHIELNRQQTETKKLRISEENEWILAAQKDLAHFEPLYKRYYPQIYEFIYRRCDNADACVDITAVVFEKAMINIGKFRIQGWPFGSWLYRIAASEIGNYYRKEKKERKVWVRTEAVFEIAGDTGFDEDKEEMLKTMFRALEKLNTDEMELIVMRYFEKRPLGEIAAITDTTEPNARVRLHRVIEKIRKICKGKTL